MLGLECSRLERGGECRVLACILPFCGPISQAVANGVSFFCLSWCEFYRPKESLSTFEQAIMYLPARNHTRYWVVPPPCWVFPGSLSFDWHLWARFWCFGRFFGMWYETNIQQIGFNETHKKRGRNRCNLTVLLLCRLLIWREQMLASMKGYASRAMKNHACHQVKLILIRQEKGEMNMRQRRLVQC